MQSLFIGARLGRSPARKGECRKPRSVAIGSRSVAPVKSGPGRINCTAQTYADLGRFSWPARGGVLDADLGHRQLELQVVDHGPVAHEQLVEDVAQVLEAFRSVNVFMPTVMVMGLFGCKLDPLPPPRVSCSAAAWSCQ